MEIYIDDRQDEINISNDIKETIKQIVREVLILEELPLDYEVSLSFVNNEEIRKLNKDFRDVDEATDVLSFPLDDDFFVEGPNLLGDIIISAEKALEQGKEFGHSLYREIGYLTVHSMFHLLGYDHMNEEDKGVMRRKEKEIMKKLEIFKDDSSEE